MILLHCPERGMETRASSHRARKHQPTACRWLKGQTLTAQGYGIITNARRTLFGSCNCNGICNDNHNRNNATAAPSPPAAQESDTTQQCAGSSTATVLYPLLRPPSSSPGLATTKDFECSITLRTGVHPSWAADAANDPRSKHARAAATATIRIRKRETRCVCTSVQNGLGRPLDLDIQHRPCPGFEGCRPLRQASTSTRKHTDKRPGLYRSPFVRSSFVLRSPELQLAWSFTISSRYPGPLNLPGRT
ncbi:hypothetical protein B0T22DRAFT_310852 [Podospora appendiculata]|uniref:Uncharacterized protein n=1 Tax=Podospora appendiculata TaxID=314037 RepID=A0AAE1C777_9PEZI|nr:hypothetical protein B0T22DRAFT_310852 [Podospora appendiculata]